MTDPTDPTITPWNVTSPTPREPYTGFIMAHQPWRRQMRGHSKMTFHTFPSLKQRSKAAELSKLYGLSKERSSSVQPPLQIGKTTTHPPDKTTTWWPSGIFLGHRPPRTHLPLHIINPNLFKWERKFPKIWFRTGGTKFTYAPEVVNYPVTFNWSIPKDKRVDKFTEKPDWPLNSPLFGSNEIYDYLEEVTLPSPPVSGETEFPQTTTQPWWTFPPWWQKKVSEEEKLGKKTRPKEAIYLKPTAGTSLKTTETPVELRMHTKTLKTELYDQVSYLNMHTKHTPALKTRQSKTTPKSFIHMPLSIAPVTHVVHHRGPWWKLTVVEHHNHKSEVLNRNKDETQRKKRSIYTTKPLIRQNAFRRKWKMNNDQFISKNKTLMIIKQNKKYTSLMKKMAKTKIAPFDYMKKQLPHRVLVKCLFAGFLRSYFKHGVKIESLLQVTPTVCKKRKLHELPTTYNQQPTTKNNELGRLYALQGLLLTKINQYDLPKNNFVLLKHIRGEISKETIKYRFKQEKQRGRYHDIMGTLVLNNLNSTSNDKMLKMLKVLSRVILINNSEQIDKVLNCIKRLEDMNKVNSLKFTTNYVNKKHWLGKVALQSVKNTISIPRSKREDSTWTQNGENVTTFDLNKATNLSSHSMETLLEEVVNEIPMRTIRTEVKKGIFTELHADKIRSLGKTKINTEVISKMVEFEAENECFGIDQETDKSVKNLIQKLLKDVLFTLRGNKWMRDAMIKIFEDGYSVKSVVEAVVNELSIESILDAMGKEGINITKPQKDMVLSEFKNYKPALTKMLEKEIHLWDNQVSNKLLSRRRRRSIHVDSVYSDFSKKVITSSLIVNKLKRREMLRKKRNIDETINLLSSLERNGEHEDLNIDKEISDLKKSSLPNVEKIKKLKKRLKWLQSQTENPSDIIFPESFEERIMITENYDDDKSNIQRAPKKRYQWSVRTKKPTLRTVTFIPRIRLERGKIFVPLTTTEEQLIIPSTLKPVLKRKKIKPAVSRKRIKVIGQEATSRPAMRPLLLKTNKPDKTAVKYTVKPKFLRRLTHTRIVTSIPETSFATLKSFHTMKFGKSTQKQVISLQEFLKRRNEYRREKEEVMWNKNFLHSSGEVLATRGTPALQDITEEKEYSTDEEELSFDAKLSGEIKASDFTLRPLSDFLFTRPTKPYTTELKRLSDMTANSLLEGSTIKSKENKTFMANKNKPSIQNSSRNENSKSIGKNISQSMSSNQVENHSSSLEKNGERRKRNIFQLQSDNSFTYMDSPKDKTEEKVNGVDHGTTTHKLDDSLIGAKQNISRRQLELKIQTNSKLRVNTKQCPNTNVESNTNVTASSFETYQQEHKKWFGVRRRGAPVNNFDIDWDQMRRKLEVQELSVWQKQKGAPRFDGKELRKYWDIKSKSKIATEVTTYKTELPTLGIQYDISQNTQKIKFAYSLDHISRKYSPFIKHDKSDENKSNPNDNNIPRLSLEPPFGKADKDGKTAFGRLYEEPKKRHYRVFDNRDPFFDEKDVKNLINNTYCADFRIMTHRKTQWHNRTFDPNFIFTQGPTERNRTTTELRQLESNRLLYDSMFHKAYNTAHSNDSKIIDSDFHNYVNALKENRFMSLRPKHQSFKDKDNNTVIINQENDTFILQRSKRIPFDNNTDLEAYKEYKRSRKRFYNKTIDIVFSYYIFHKFKCGNFTRDLGYGRMSNVVNRWYNRTFIPKYRPDMFYVHNRYKVGKEFNFFRNEFNILHSMISEGTFDPSKWGHVLMTRNSTRSSSVDKCQLNETEETNKCMKEKISNLNSNHKPPEIVQFSTEMNIKSPVRTINPNFKHKQNTDKTTLRFSIRSRSAVYRSQFPSTRTPFTSITKKSFFKAVKDKGFVFLKSLFGITNKNNDASK